MKRTLLIITFLAFAFNLQAQTDEYKQNIKKLLQVSGAEESFKVVIKQMLGQYRMTKSDVPSEYWDEVENEFLKSPLDDLVELLAPIYANHLENDDVLNVIKFYETPVGKKFAEKTPLINQESMVAGQQWGMKIAQRIQEKLSEGGY